MSALSTPTAHTNPTPEKGATMPTTYVDFVDTSAVAHAIGNLRHWIEEARTTARAKGECTPSVVVAAEHLLAALEKGAIEDREYGSYDLALPVEERCGAYYGKWGRACSRRDGHINERHRDGEISWTDEMAEMEAGR